MLRLAQRLSALAADLSDMCNFARTLVHHLLSCVRGCRRLLRIRTPPCDRHVGYPAGYGWTTTMRAVAIEPRILDDSRGVEQQFPTSRQSWILRTRRWHTETLGHLQTMILFHKGDFKSDFLP